MLRTKPWLYRVFLAPHRLLRFCFKFVWPDPSNNGHLIVGCRYRIDAIIMDFQLDSKYTHTLLYLSRVSYRRDLI